jgi:hypothetical protein
MPFTSEPSLLALQGLRLAGFSSVEKVAALSGLSIEDIQRELDACAGCGWATYKEGRMSGWVLTADGRAEGERRLEAELEACGARAVVDDCYRRYLALNGQMLGVCTEWQMTDAQTLNDHSDADYDAKVIAKLVELDEGVQPICAELGAALARFGAYGPRLGDALAKLRAGDNDWFTKPMIPSYHTVRFEMHEDLLATLNIDRAKEGQA